MHFFKAHLYSNKDPRICFDFIVFLMFLGGNDFTQIISTKESILFLGYNEHLHAGMLVCVVFILLFLLSCWKLQLYYEFEDDSHEE